MTAKVDLLGYDQQYGLGSFIGRGLDLLDGLSHPIHGFLAVAWFHPVGPGTAVVGRDQISLSVRPESDIPLGG